MMKLRVIGKAARMGVGTVIRDLDKDQLRRRIKRLKAIGEGVYELKEALEFKHGESFSVDFDDIPKYLSGAVEVVKKLKTPETKLTELNTRKPVENKPGK